MLSHSVDALMQVSISVVRNRPWYSLGGVEPIPLEKMRTTMVELYSKVGPMEGQLDQVLGPISSPSV